MRIAVWVAAEGSRRQGDARDFLSGVRTFHTTGSWDTIEELTASVVARMREMAAEEDSPWLKLGGVVFRAASIADDGRTLTVEMASRDRDVLAAFEEDASGRMGAWQRRRGGEQRLRRERARDRGRLAGLLGTAAAPSSLLERAVLLLRRAFRDPREESVAAST